MTKKLNKTVNHQLRVSKDQDNLLTAAYKHYMASNEKVITLSEFVRQQLMLQCLRILRIIDTTPVKESKTEAEETNKEQQ